MHELLKHNGPAIWGGCVTWRSHPATNPGTLAGKLSRWQDRYGVLFAYPDTKFIVFVSDRDTRFLSGRKLIRVNKFDKWALVQHRGTRFISGW